MTPEEPTPLCVPADLTTALDRVLSDAAEAGVIGARAVRDALDAARATVPAGPEECGCWACTHNDEGICASCGGTEHAAVLAARPVPAGPWDDNPDGTERHYVSPVPAVEPEGDADHAKDWPNGCPTCRRAFGSVPAVDEDRERLTLLAARLHGYTCPGKIGTAHRWLGNGQVACIAAAHAVAGVSTGTATPAGRSKYGGGMWENDPVIGVDSFAALAPVETPRPEGER